MAEVWAVLEYREGIFHEHSGELLAELAEVAQCLQEQTALCALVLVAPSIASPDTTLLSGLGMRHLYLVEHPFLANYSTEGYVSALTWLIQQRKPLLVAANATANARDWMPRLATRLHLPFVPACLGLDLHDDGLFALRMIYEGRAYIQTRTMLHGRSALATLLPGTRGTPPAREPEQPATIHRIKPELVRPPEQERVHSIAIEAPAPDVVELEAAERIVAGGRGIGQRGFTHLASFARLLGAAVGATRVATDHGWIEHARQIGTTGKNVHPKLYIACGISGAAQHTSGMREAQTVVAINPDRNAPIFAVADLGLLGDANQIVLVATELLQGDRNSSAFNEL